MEPLAGSWSSVGSWFPGLRRWVTGSGGSLVKPAPLASLIPPTDALGSPTRLEPQDGDHYRGSQTRRRLHTVGSLRLRLTWAASAVGFSTANGWLQKAPDGASSWADSSAHGCPWLAASPNHSVDHCTWDSFGARPSEAHWKWSQQRVDHFRRRALHEAEG